MVKNLMISHKVIYYILIIVYYITQKIPEANEYESGYLVLVGDRDKMKKTADNEENPYYHKLEQKEELTKTAYTENLSRK